MAKLSFPGYEGFAFIPYAPVKAVSETHEFLTDIVATHDGSEVRTITRDIARRSYRYSIPNNIGHRQETFNLLDQNLRGAWAVPLWTQAQKIDNLTGSVIPCDLIVSDFRAGDLVLAFQTNDVWQIRQISSLTDDGIVVSEGFDDLANCFLIPVVKGRIRGDVDYDLGSYTSVFKVNYEVDQPEKEVIALSALFSLDVSNSMSGWPLTTAFAAMTSIVTTLKGAVAASGLRLDLGLSFWPYFTGVHDFHWNDMSVEDCDEALDIIAAQGIGLSAPPLYAFEYGHAYFSGYSVNPGDGRKDMMFYISDLNVDMDACQAEMQNEYDRTAPFSGAKSVDMYAVAVDFTSMTEISKVHNVPGTVPLVLTSSNTADLLSLFIRAVEPVIGQQYDGYELLTVEPMSEDGITGAEVTQQEDRADFGGVVSSRTPWLRSRRVLSYMFETNGLRDFMEFRRFLYRRQGRARPFYLPTFQHDLEFLSMDVDRKVVTVNTASFRAYNNERQTVACQYDDGVWQGNRIVSATDDDGITTITFEDAFYRRPERMRQVSYIGLARLVADRIETQWVGGQYAETTLGIVELHK